MFCLSRRIPKYNIYCLRKIAILRSETGETGFLVLKFKPHYIHKKVDEIDVLWILEKNKKTCQNLEFFQREFRFLKKLKNTNNVNGTYFHLQKDKQKMLFLNLIFKIRGRWRKSILVFK